MKADARKAKAEADLMQTMKDRPDIDPLSKKIMQETSQSAYSQMKVEDRLRMKSAKLREG